MENGLVPKPFLARRRYQLIRKDKRKNVSQCRTLHNCLWMCLSAFEMLSAMTMMGPKIQLNRRSSSWPSDNIRKRCISPVRIITFGGRHQTPLWFLSNTSIYNTGVSHWRHHPTHTWLMVVSTLRFLSNNLLFSVLHSSINRPTLYGTSINTITYSNR